MKMLKGSRSLDAFFQESPRISFQKKQILLGPQDHPGVFYYLESGSVRSYSITEWGEEKLGVIYRPGEIFPLLYIFDRKPLTRTYEALEQISVRKCRVDDFVTFVQDSRDALIELASNAADLMSVFSDRIDVLEYTKAYARTIAFLLHCAKRFGVPQKNGTGCLIDVPISHRDIASGIATARETATRELQKLERKKLISHHRNLIVITDIKLLEDELASFHQPKGI